MSISIKQTDRFVLCLALTLIPVALYGQDADRTPALLQGGLVRQLRSLSQEAMQKIRGSEVTPPTAQVPSPRRVTTPPSRQPTRRAPTTSRSPGTPRPGVADDARGADRLPQILSSEQANNLDTGRVYVETELPPGVVPQSRVPPRTVAQQPSDSAQYSSLSDQTAEDRFSDLVEEESFEPQPPRVSRVPLPGTTEVAENVSPLEQPESKTATVVENHKLTPPRAMSSVSVPTNLVAGPAIEQANRQLPTASISDDNNVVLPKLPQSLSNSTTTEAPPAVDMPRQPLPAATVNRIQEKNDAIAGSSSEGVGLNNNLPNLPNGLPALTNNGPSSTTPPPQPRSQGNRERLKLEAPHIQVLLNGPADLPLGVPAEYEVIVRNDDRIDLQGLMLRMDIPAGVQVQSLAPSHGEFDVERTADGMTLLTWAFDHLAAGQAATAPMELIATTSKNFAVAMEWTLVPIAADADIDVLAPRLELALEGPAEVSYGQPKIYRLHVRNPGNAAASQVAVQLSAEPYGSSSTTIGEIAPGEEEIIDVELTFNQRGPINISAEATAQGGLSSSTGIDVLVRQALLEAKLVAPAVVYSGAAAEYVVRLSNSGDADAIEMQAVVRLPAGAELVSAPPAASQRGNDLTWPVPRLAAGGSTDFAVSLRLAGEGQHTLNFDCEAAGGISASCLAKTQVEAITDLKLLVSDPVAPAPVGGEVVYELSLTNRGSKAATNVKVVAQFSEGIEPVRGEGQAFRVVPGQVFFDPIPQVAAGESLKLRVFAAAETEGVHLFRVEVRSDDNEVRLVQEESTQYLQTASRLASPGSGAVIR